MTRSVLDIDADLRLVRLDAPPAEALSWYQDPETLLMVDGKREPYTPERLARMHTTARRARRALVHRGARRGHGGRLASRSATSRSARATSPSSLARRTSGRDTSGGA